MLNKVILIGNLGKDPVVKHFSNDNAIAEFSLATNESYKDKDGNWVKLTEWHNIKIPFKRQAEIAEKYLKKGSTVFIEGKIKTRDYQDKDGNKRYITEIVAETFRLMDKKSDSSDTSGGGSYTPSVSQESTSSSAPAIDDDLPF